MAPVRAPRPRWRPVWFRWRSARIRPGRCGSRRRCVVWSASSRRTARCLPMESSRCRRASTTSAYSRRLSRTPPTRSLPSPALSLASGPRPPRLGVVTNPEYLETTAGSRCCVVGRVGHVSPRPVPSWSTCELPDWAAQLPHRRGPPRTRGGGQPRRAIHRALPARRPATPPRGGRRSPARSTTPPGPSRRDHRRAERPASARSTPSLTPTVLTTAPLITAADTEDAGLAVRAQLLRTPAWPTSPGTRPSACRFRLTAFPSAYRSLLLATTSAAAVAGWIEDQR